MKKLLLLFTVLLTVLTACKSSENKETLNLYTWDGMFPQEVLDNFTKETGISINYSNFDTDEAMLAKLEESNAKDYDLVIADDYIIDVAIKENLVQKLDKSKITTYENINPIFQSNFFDKDNEYTIPYGAGIPLIVYNPNEIDFEVTGYEDLWNEKLEGSVGILGNYRVINGMALKTLGYSFNTNNLEEVKQAGEKLLKLSKNIRVIDDNNLQDYLISGEVSIAFMYTSQVTAALKANKDFKVVYPKEGLGFGVMAAFIPSNAKNVDSANKFLEYINQPEIAAKCYEHIGYYVTNKASEQYISDDMKDYIILPSDKEELVEKGEVISNVDDATLELHSEIFSNFKQATK